MRDGSLVETYTLPMYLSTFVTELYAESALINKTWPKFCFKELGADFWELSWNLLKGCCWLGTSSYLSCSCLVLCVGTMCVQPSPAFHFASSSSSSSFSFSLLNKVASFLLCQSDATGRDHVFLPPSIF